LFFFAISVGYPNIYYRTYYITSQNACSKGHFYDVIQERRHAQRAQGEAQRLALARISAYIISQVKMLARKGIFTT
ncbi:MAG: hypothetical protein ACI3X1_00440, partial [Eubacteriales bacterium]